MFILREIETLKCEEEDAFDETFYYHMIMMGWSVVEQLWDCNYKGE